MADGNGNGKNKKALVLSGILLVAMLATTAFFAWRTKNEIFTRTENEFKIGSGEISTVIKRAFDLNLSVLYAIRSHLINAGVSNYSQWESFLDRIDLDRTCPCATAVNFAERVKKENLASFIRAVRSDKSLDIPEYRDFKIYPETDKPEYFVNRYVYPKGRETAIGFDLGSEEVRRKAIERARDSGNPSISGPVLSVVTGETSFIIFLPVYKTAETPKTAEDRRESLRGFVIAVFRINDFMRDSLNGLPEILKTADIEIFEKPNGRLSPENLIFDSNPKELRAVSPFYRPNLTVSKTLYPFSPYWDLLFYSQNIAVADKIWAIYFYSPASAWALDTFQRWGGWMALIIGAIISFLSAFILWSLLTSRRRALERTAVLTVELAKSEKQYREMVESSPFAIAVHSEGRVVMANKAATELIGAKTAEEVIGKPILEIVHPDYHKIVMERIKKELEAKLPAPPLEEKFIKLDGTVIDVLVAGFPIVFAGKPAVQVVIQNITDRKRAEKELKEHTEQLEKLNKVLIGRELRMAELKKELEELKKRGKQND